MTAPIRPEVALPLILLHARNLRDLADRNRVDPLIVRALAGIAEDLAGVVEQTGRWVYATPGAPIVKSCPFDECTQLYAAASA